MLVRTKLLIFSTVVSVAAGTSGGLYYTKSKRYEIEQEKLIRDSNQDNNGKNSTPPPSEKPPKLKTE